MVTVTRAKRRSAVLTPSGLACLSVLPTINLTAGCLHHCVYCYIRGYRNYPGESKVVLYEDTLGRLRHELRPGQPKPRAVYFSPSSDLFQPAPEVSELSHAVLEFLFSQGVGVAFLTKGEIPDETLELLVDHADLVQAQIGLITLDEEVAAALAHRRRYRRGCPLGPDPASVDGRRRGVGSAIRSLGAGGREAGRGRRAVSPSGHFVLAGQEGAQRDAGAAAYGLSRRRASGHARRR